MIADTLRKLDFEVDNEWHYIEQVINYKPLKNKTEIFSDAIMFSSIPVLHTDVGNKLRGRHGVYVILLTEAITLTQEEIEEFNKLKGAKIKKASGEFYTEVDCLYVGSSVINSLYTRIRNHFKADYRGASLHLENPNRKKFLDKIRVFAFPIKKEYEPYLKYLVPSLERKMHDEFYPIAGSPR